MLLVWPAWALINGSTGMGYLCPNPTLLAPVPGTGGLPCAWSPSYCRETLYAPGLRPLHSPSAVAACSWCSPPPVDPALTCAVHSLPNCWQVRRRPSSSYSLDLQPQTLLFFWVHECPPRW